MAPCVALIDTPNKKRSHEIRYRRFGGGNASRSRTPASDSSVSRRVISARNSSARVVAHPQRMSGLFRAALASLRLIKVALTRVRPSPPIAIKDFSQFIDYFGSNPPLASEQASQIWPQRLVLLSIECASDNFEQAVLGTHPHKIDAQVVTLNRRMDTPVPWIIGIHQGVLEAVGRITLSLPRLATKRKVS